MSGFLDRFRGQVVTSVYRDNPALVPPGKIDDKIALGVLLWEVACADSKFLPKERDKIKEVLINFAQVTKEELPYVLRSVELAGQERIDLYRFTHHISEELNYRARVMIIKVLFRVAFSDGELDEVELAVIRKIAGLFSIAHGDFIEAKLEIKKELALGEE
ncbi:MAG: TerB family tellurite resistance protein [Candidatus Omnitrophota bacterium]